MKYAKNFEGLRKVVLLPNGVGLMTGYDGAGDVPK